LAVDVTIDGTDVIWNAEDYLVVEDATPVDPSDTSGGFGRISVTIPGDGDIRYLEGKTLKVDDGTQGTMVGTIRGLDGDEDGGVMLTADSRLYSLNIRRNVPPMSGTLEEVFNLYLEFCGIVADVYVEESIKNIPVVNIGGDVNILNRLRQMLSAKQVEMSLVSNNIVLRPLRQRALETRTDDSVAWQLDDTGLAETVEIAYYQPRVATGTMYPIGGNNDNAKSIQIAARETIELELPIAQNGIGPGASATSVLQPTCVDVVDPSGNYSESVYSVLTSDGETIAPAAWIAAGGNITVSITEDTRILKVVVTGAALEDGPFRIASAPIKSEAYQSLRIVGTGVFFDKQILTLPAVVEPTQEIDIAGHTVDNESIETLSDAFNLGLWTAARYSGSSYTLSVSATTVNTEGDNGSYRYLTIGEFDALWAGKTIQDFDTFWAGKTIQDFDDFYKEYVSADFVNQAFGNIGGARRLEGGHMMRVRSASLTPAGVRYSAEMDTTIGDFDAVWAGKTIQDFDDYWGTRMVREFGISPLEAL
jgi:hypothetical protein